MLTSSKRRRTARSSVAVLTILDTGIDHHITDVNKSINENITRRYYQHGCLDHRVIARQHGTGGILPYARYAKDLLDDERTTQ